MDRNKGKLTKAERMQLKAWICRLGLLLIAILFLGHFWIAYLNRDVKPGKVPIPVIEVLSNVWVIENGEGSILIYRDGNEERYVSRLADDGAPLGGNLADITLTDGEVTELSVKSEKMNGRILSVDDSSVEVEGHGVLPLSKDYKGYRIYNTLAMCSAGDLCIGYDFADLVMEDGEICGILIAKEESMEYIRVLLKRSDYAGLLHEQVVLTADADFTVTYGNYDNPLQEVHQAGEELTIGTDSDYFVGERIVVTPNILTGKVLLKNVHRSQGTPAYRGHIELLCTEEGIAVINEVSLEEYLYCVVPSEMPSTYPNEALKAQAVCARTYAYGHMLKAGYPGYGAHVDDSTSYQVYNNILEQASTTTAVKETYGQLLYTEAGGLAGTYYYSTSCGVGSDAAIWKTEAAQSIDYLKAQAISKTAMRVSADEADVSNLQEEDAFRTFITAKNVDDFEVSEGWYRWSYTVKQIDATRICDILRDRYQSNEKLILTLDGEEYVSRPIEEFERILDISVAKRGAGGIADELLIVTEKYTYKVISEHNIRYVLNNGESKVIRQDGSEVNSPTILPSAFFVLEIAREKENVVGYTLSGGGFGHGVGMSQNAAKEMANNGYTAEEILMFFYDKCSVRNIYEG